MNKIKLGMLGSCVTRDAMQTVIDGYDIQNYVTFISPYTMQNGATIDIPERIFIDRGINNFTIRCLRLDASNKAIDYLSEFKSDWFLMDLIPLQGKIYEWPQYGLLLSQPHQFSKCIPVLKEYLNGEPIIKECWEVPEEVLYERVRQLCKSLLAFLNPSRIILNETYGAFDFIGKLKTLINFNAQIIEQFKKINTIYKKCNEICKECLPGCHIISPISNVVAFENHRWGLHPLHYCDEYYVYVAKAVAVITNSGNPESEKLELQYLNTIYTQEFITIREQAKCEAIKLERNKWQTYSTFFKLLILNNQLNIDGNLIFQIQNELVKKGYRHISIYGDTEITKVLCSVLKDTAISIDYIVENASNPVLGFKTLNRNPADYPDCDVMLIADIYNFKDIKAKLEKLKVPFPFYNAAEFIQSLPVAEGDGISRIKEQIRQLNDRIAAEQTEKEKLNEQLSASCQKEAMLTQQVDDLIERDSENKKKIQCLNKGISELALSNKNIAEERDSYISELESVRNSLSFRLGRAATFIPRKLRDVFKKK